MGAREADKDNKRKNMNNIKNTFCAGLVIAAGMVVMHSCNDTWDNHYESGLSTLTFNGTLMQALEETAPDFAKVVKAYGFSHELTSDNTHTVWAPADGSFNLSDYVGANGERVADSADVVNQFLKNHVALYGMSLISKDQTFNLLNKKSTTMTGDAFFGESKMDEEKSNMSCENGILHILEAPSSYNFNLFEMIAKQYKEDPSPDKETSSLYAILYDPKVNKDTLIESKSVSRGVDEDGNKIWVNKYFERNNTLLKNIDAPLYEEDSSFIAILPTAKAWSERYKKAESLLKFNPSEDSRAAGTCDSLTAHYATAFAMMDLFYNKKANSHMEDSLKSTDYYDIRRHEVIDWTRHVYYSKEPRVLPEDKGVNDILAKVGDPVECSKGTAHIVDEYPMSPVEQFFARIDVKAGDRTVNTLSNNGLPTYTTNVGLPAKYRQGTYTSRIETEDGTETLRQPFSYGDFEQEATSSNIEVGFNVSNTLSGTYDIYVVTCPMWLKDYAQKPDMEDWDLRPYRFIAKVIERYNGEEDGLDPKKIGTLPSPVNIKELVNPNPVEDEDDPTIFRTPEGIHRDEKGFIIVNDTTYLGQYQFKNAYYGRPDYGVIIQISSNVTAQQVRRGLYSREMLISSIILKPHDEDTPLEEVVEGEESKMRKSNQLTTLNIRK